MPEINTYDVGDRVELSFVFRDDEGAPTDPTTIVVKVRKPAGTVTTYTFGVDVALERDSAGRYALELTLDTAGSWSYRGIGTGAVEQAGERRFTVREAVVA